MSAITPPLARRAAARRSNDRSVDRSNDRRSERGSASASTTRGRVTPVRAGVFGVFIGILLLLGLVAMLLINTSLAQGAFRMSELNRQATELVQQRQALEQLVAQQQTPANLEQRARAMGMVPQGVPAFLRLSDGAILGKVTPQEAQAQQLDAAGAPLPMGQATPTPSQWTPWIEPGVAP